MNEIKAVLFDVDGLVIIGEEGLFSERYSRDYGIPMEDVSEFFVNDLKKCSFGKADLKEEIAPYLKKWGWKGSVDDFLKYWFERESSINPEVLEIVSRLREQGIKCYLATRQEKYRARYFLDTLGLKNYFDGMFCTCDIGYDKNEEEYWNTVVEELSCAPQEIVFFDDKQRNVEFANNYGIHAFLYEGIETLHHELANILK